MIGLVIGLLGWGLPGTPDNLAVHVASWAMFLHVGGAHFVAGLSFGALDTGDGALRATRRITTTRQRRWYASVRRTPRRWRGRSGIPGGRGRRRC